MTLSLEQMKANRKAWVEALRSGEYQQERNQLKGWDGSMCCLGVLCDVAGIRFTLNGLRYEADGESSIAPESAMQFVGLRDNAGDHQGLYSLAEYNDNGAPFSEIADIIESEPEGLFIESVADGGTA